MVDEKIFKLCQFLEDNKAEKIAVFTTKKGAIVDYFVVCSALNYIHAKAIIDSVKQKVEENGLFEVCGAEGFNISNWHVLDLESCFLHVMTREIREKFTIDKLFSDENNCITFERLKKKFEKQEKAEIKKRAKNEKPSKRLLKKDKGDKK